MGKLDAVRRAAVIGDRSAVARAVARGEQRGLLRRMAESGNEELTVTNLATGRKTRSSLDPYGGYVETRGYGPFAIDHSHPDMSSMGFRPDLPAPLSQNDLYSLVGNRSWKDMAAFEQGGGVSAAVRGGRANHKNAQKAIEQGSLATEDFFGHGKFANGVEENDGLRAIAVAQAARKQRILSKYGYMPNDAQFQDIDLANKDLKAAVRAAYRAMHEPIHGLPYPITKGGLAATAAVGAGALAMQPGEAEAAVPTSAIRRAIKAGDELGYNRNYTRGMIKFGSEGMTPEARMARAREMGFDVDTPTYHGTRQGDIPAFEFGRARDGSFLDSELTDVQSGRGVSLALSPEHAERYATPGVRYAVTPTQQRWLAAKFLPNNDYDGYQRAQETLAQNTIERMRPTVMPLVTVKDRANVTMPKGYAWNTDEGALMDQGLAKARKSGARAATVRNVTEGDQIAVFDRSAIRSPFATFDPARAHRRDLLAGVVPVAGVGAAGAIATRPQDAQAATPDTALARALARQLEKDVGARRREAQGGLGYRIGQLATGLVQSAIEDPFAALDPTWGALTAVRDDVKTDMDAARSRKTSEVLRRAMLRSAPQVKRGQFSGRDTE